MVAAGAACLLSICLVGQDVVCDIGLGCQFFAGVDGIFASFWTDHGCV